MSVHLQPVQLATGSDDTEGQLVFVDGGLVAVLVHLSEQHDDEAGAYSDEAGRGFRFEAGRHSDLKPATVPI